MTETGTGAPGGPAGAAAGQDAPGLDLAAFGAYFTAAYPGTVRGPLRASVLAGGKSNITRTARPWARDSGDIGAAPEPLIRAGLTILNSSA